MMILLIIISLVGLIIGLVIDKLGYEVSIAIVLVTVIPPGYVLYAILVSGFEILTSGSIQAYFGTT
ncbi:hypothetical protein [Clostridium akagii]|uniref:hypothetical protein n=1 Tax=Clostridium akagii TaxID=91623 RepID=UPI00047DB5C9|nr:hypothetical protein [Clostridium akagii]